MILIAAQVQHSLPTFLKATVNSTRYLAQKFPRINSLKKIHHAARNWYEGGWPIWTGGNYSYLPSLVQDARFDQNYVTRREMMRRMRYWSQNSALLESILSVGERYTVGSGGLTVSCYPADGGLDDEIEEDNWYERAEQVIAEWFKDCGWNCETMERLLKIGYRCQKVDGEVFYIKTRKLGFIEYDGRKVQVYKPCLQAVEAHRVETPWTKFDDYNLIDGVQFKLVDAGDGKEKRQLLSLTGFWCRNGMGGFEQNDSWNLIEKENCFHLFNMHRVNQYRGLSDFYSCSMDLHKLEDLVEIELKAQNSQSIRAVGIESNSGQATSPLDPKLEAVRIARGQGSTPTNTGEKELFARYEMFRKETGAYVYGLKTGEKVHFDSPNRPSESTLQLWEFLVNSVCAGGKVPRCLVFNLISGSSARPQGTQVRADLDNADLFFKSDFQKWKHFLIDAVIWYLEWAIKNDLRVSDPPANWRSCLHIQQPEACNVDVGYTTQSNLALLSAGAMDYEEIIGPRGSSFITVAKRLARQQRFLEKNNIRVTLPAQLQAAQQHQLDDLKTSVDDFASSQK